MPGKKKRKKEEETEEHIKKKRGKLGKIPVLRRLENDKIAQDEARKILEQAEEVYVPKKSREEARGKEKESAGKTRIYKTRRNGKNIAVVIPRFKDEYAFKKDKEKVVRSLKGMKGRTLRNKERLKEAIEEGETGIAHTHVSEEKPALSKHDKTQIKHAGSIELVVSPEEARIGYKSSQGEVKEKKAKFIPKEELGKLMKDKVKERAKKRNLPIKKKKR